MHHLWISIGSHICCGYCLTRSRSSVLDDEPLSRCLVLAVDESPEQTRKIHAHQRAAHSVEGLLAREHREQVLGLHHNAQRLLRPVRVVNPHLDELSFPDSAGAGLARVDEECHGRDVAPIVGGGRSAPARARRPISEWSSSLVGVRSTLGRGPVGRVVDLGLRERKHHDDQQLRIAAAVSSARSENRTSRARKIARVPRRTRTTGHALLMPTQGSRVSRTSATHDPNV